ncbi:outer membrane usher protein [Povalibacter uvarum]|uniref:Outer membrane usher protein n=1 Tax=Povalibacter uvarum TaxID=732238 RepID=A0A841HSD1_9GAMM|nr:fimbria/pilus outer membrane usher protein [Povalibacter uvarum]MBB6096291.1 outer membrane usher protein [Povalibacter uvarum]
MAIASVPASTLAQSGAAALATETLYLQVFVNGFDKQLIVRVDREGDTLYISGDDLDAIGIPPDALSAGVGGIALRNVPGLTYRYRALEQRLDLTIDPGKLRAQLLGSSAHETVEPSSDYGLALDYAIQVQDETITLTERLQRQRAPLVESRYGRLPVQSQSDVAEAYEVNNENATLGVELRFFGPFGLISTDGHAVMDSDEYRHIRDESFWTYSEVGSLRTYTVGDYISSSLDWSRAIRLGGARVSRNFELRPDLVTFPLPALGGTAVVPTTVDMYVNGIRQFSGQSNPGPFQFSDPPSLTGAGLVSIVYQDAFGRELTFTRPLYVDSRMLETGLSDYAAEVGYPRRNFGSSSSDYAQDPVGVGSLRYGVNDGLTLEGHTELARGLSNGGAGLLVALGQYGVLSAAAAFSDGGGTLTSLGYQFIAPQWSFDIYDRRAREGYRDLGTLEGVPVPDRLTRAGLTLSFAQTQSLTFTYARQQASATGGSRIASVGYSASWFSSRLSLFVNAFEDLDLDDSGGVYLGANYSFDNRVSIDTSFSRYGDERTATVGASRPVDYDLGGFGWKVAAEAGNESYRRGAGRLDYRGRYGDWTAFAQRVQSEGSEYTQSGLFGTGSFVYMGGELFASRAIYDGFALVSTDGQPDVPVLRENRLLGRTNRRGYLLVNDLPAYRTSRLAIDPLTLPVDMSVAKESIYANPESRAGVLVEFTLDRYRGATAIIVDEDGSPLPAGTRATLDTGESALIGFDGQVFFPVLQPMNRLRVDTDDGNCIAEVPFDERQAMQTIGPFVCTPVSAP